MSARLLHEWGNTWMGNVQMCERCSRGRTSASETEECAKRLRAAFDTLTAMDDGIMRALTSWRQRAEAAERQQAFWAEVSDDPESGWCDRHPRRVEADTAGMIGGDTTDGSDLCLACELVAALARIEALERAGCGRALAAQEELRMALATARECWEGMRGILAAHGYAAEDVAAMDAALSEPAPADPGDARREEREAMPGALDVLRAQIVAWQRETFLHATPASCVAQTALHEKLRINRARKWGAVNAEGFVEHERGEEENP